MEVFYDIDGYRACPSAVCVGVFDGLHLGHRALLAELVDEARHRGVASVVVTFDPHPRIVLSKGNDRVGLLTTPSERIELLGRKGDAQQDKSNQSPRATDGAWQGGLSGDQLNPKDDDLPF